MNNIDSNSIKTNTEEEKLSIVNYQLYLLTFLI